MSGLAHTQGLQVADERAWIEFVPLSLGRSDGALTTVLDLGSSTVRGAHVLRREVSFRKNWCTNRLGATGSGEGVILPSQSVHLDGGHAYLRDRDEGLCVGRLVGRRRQQPGACCCRAILRVVDGTENARTAVLDRPAPVPFGERSPEVPIVEVVFLPASGELVALTPDEQALLDDEARATQGLHELLWDAALQADPARLEAARRKVQELLRWSEPGRTSELTEVHRLGRSRKVVYLRREVEEHFHRRAVVARLEPTPTGARVVALDVSVRVVRRTTMVRRVRTSLENDDRNRSELSTDRELDWRKVKRRLTKPDRTGRVRWSAEHERHLNTWATSKVWKHHEVSADATAIRFLAAGSTTLELVAEERRLSLALEGTLSLSMAEGRAALDVFLPRGFLHARVQTRTQEIDFGEFRIRLRVALDTFAGASLTFCGRAELKLDKTPREDLRISGEAFAGVRGSVGPSVELQWRPPDAGTRVLASGGYRVTGSTGIGAEANFHVRVNDRGQLQVVLKAGVVLGFGGGAALEFEVDGGEVAALVLCVVRALRACDFQRLSRELSAEAFEFVCAALEWQLVHGWRLVAAAQEQADRILERWRAVLASRAEVTALADAVLKNPALFQDAPPEAKGRWLHTLAQKAWPSLHERQEEAIVALVRSIRTRREYRLVRERMSPAGKKEYDGRRVDPDVSEERLRRILDGREQDAFDAWKSTIVEGPLS